ncbi:MAG TPA: putative lipid II flippase FtsW [Alphaproteobacteria bacterium]|nr:putative lipid II flippase FtsW [Alphaproteobacteria bacterium]
MSTFARTDTSILGQWWWTVDRWILGAIGLLIIVGTLLTLAASPSVAERINMDGYFFVKKHLMLLPVGLVIMFGVSLAPPNLVKRLAVALLVFSFILMLLTLTIGEERNGAQRWLSLGGMSLQPSEFLKPALIVFAAWMFSEQNRASGVPGNLIALGAWATAAGMLAMQPDFGQAFLVTVVIGGMFFVAGMPMILVGGLLAVGAVGGVFAYLYVPHVTSRIDRFLDPASGDTFQVNTAINAFRQGGPFGRGPGEGVVKRILPDAHTDYIFAVVGEEFGAIACLLVVSLFAFIVLRGLARAFAAEDHFTQLAASGLIFLFGLQAAINMAVNLNLLPSKGMTLPFISYGGSSLLALSLTAGMILALLRRRPGIAIGGASVGRAT